MRLAAGGEDLVTTVDHPFYVRGAGFVNAGVLKAGALLIAADGAAAAVESVTVERTDGPVTVYNFKVEDCHTYHVGSCGILVHNAEYTSKDKYVGETANAIEKEFPGRVECLNGEIYRADGSTHTEFDIELDTIVIQVKSGSGKKLTAQIKRSLEVTDKNVICFTTDLKATSALIKDNMKIGGCV